MNKIAIIVVGGLNTDITVSGIPDFPHPGGYRVGHKVSIGAGGKSRNIAQMIAVLSGKPKSVAMVSRTVKDKFGLWQPPYQALVRAGINTEYVVFSRAQPDSYPGIALIPVDKNGTNEIFLAPGENANFSPRDIDSAAPIFEEASASNGLLALSLESPLPTALHAVKSAAQHRLKVILDPGGLESSMNFKSLLKSGIFVIKPNEYEAELLTGIKITDIKSASAAASILLAYNINYVLITAGKKGAYLFGPSLSLHIRTPRIAIDPLTPPDETGCGDQTTAALCVLLSNGADIKRAARAAVAAGTLQFNREGIKPVTPMELDPLIV